MFMDYMAFLLTAGLSVLQVDTIVILAFVEFLYENKLSSDNISNYLVAIREVYVTYGLPTKAVRDERIQMFMCSFKINRPFGPVVPAFITQEILH